MSYCDFCDEAVQRENHIVVLRSRNAMASTLLTFCTLREMVQAFKEGGLLCEADFADDLEKPQEEEKPQEGGE